MLDFTSFDVLSHVAPEKIIRDVHLIRKILFIMIKSSVNEAFDSIFIEYELKLHTIMS